MDTNSLPIRARVWADVPVVCVRLATPTISKENNTLASARQMEAGLKETPELKAEASGKARGCTSRDGTASTQPLLTVA